jgi:hypothetical protein
MSGGVHLAWDGAGQSPTASILAAQVGVGCLLQGLTLLVFRWAKEEALTKWKRIPIGEPRWRVAL